MTVPAHRNYRVANHKAVPVTIYDYYNREQQARMFYEPTLAPTCKICEGDECGPSCNSVAGADGSSSSRAKDKKSEQQRATGGTALPAFLASSSSLFLLLIVNLVTSTLLLR